MKHEAWRPLDTDNGRVGAEANRIVRTCASRSWLSELVMSISSHSLLLLTLLYYYSCAGLPIWWICFRLPNRSELSTLTRLPWLNRFDCRGPSRGRQASPQPPFDLSVLAPTWRYLIFRSPRSASFKTTYNTIYPPTTNTGSQTPVTRVSPPHPSSC